MNSGRSNVIIPLILFLTVFLVFGNSLFHRFTYDDHEAIYPGAFVTSWSNLPDLFTGNYFTETSEKSYRPVVTFSHFLEYSIWGMNPAGYHLINLMLHATAVILFYFFLQIFFKNREGAMFGALLFAVHPIVTEPVNAISFREDLMAGMFVLAAWLSAFRISKHIFLKSVLCALFSILAYFSKESATPFILMIPVFLILFCKADSEKNPYCPHSRSFYIYFMPMQIAVLLLFLIIRFVIMRPGGAYTTEPLGNSGIAAAFHGGFLFLKAWYLFFVPVILNADYVFHHIEGIITPWSISGLAFLVFYCTILIWTCFKGKRIACFAFLWILLFFLPAMNIIPLTNPFAERYLYLPFMGFAIFAVCGYEVLRKIAMKKDSLERLKYLRLTAFLIILILAFLSIRRNLVWGTDKILWETTLKTEPESVRALNGAALSKIAEGDLKKAENLLIRALELKPADYEVRNNLAVVYLKTGRTDLALDQLQKAISLKPDLASAHYNLARIYSRRKNLSRAKQHLELAKKYGFPVPVEFSGDLNLN